jgi:hypothetical protein
MVYQAGFVYFGSPVSFCSTDPDFQDQPPNQITVCWRWRTFQHPAKMIRI